MKETGEDPKTQSVEPHDLWIEARRNKEGIITDPPTMEIYDNIVSVISLVNFLICNKSN